MWTVKQRIKIPRILQSKVCLLRDECGVVDSPYSFHGIIGQTKFGPEADKPRVAHLLSWPLHRVKHLSAAPERIQIHIRREWKRLLIFTIVKIVTGLIDRICTSMYDQMKSQTGQQYKHSEEGDPLTIFAVT